MSALLAGSALPWRDIDVVESTGSTNSDLLARLEQGMAHEGSVIAAGEQVAGRGRRGRVWASPPGTTLSFSVALAPPASRAGFVPVLAAVAVAVAIADVTGLAPTLKWPNDVMLAGGSDVGSRGERGSDGGVGGAGGVGGKVAGILAEGGTGGVVVGCGINVSVPHSALPVDTATSLSEHAAPVDRAELLVAALTHLHGSYERWREAGFSAAACGLLDRYRSMCATIGSPVSVLLPDGSQLTGTATAIDDDGRLEVAGPHGTRLLSAGDVTHLRPGRVPISAPDQ